MRKISKKGLKQKGKSKGLAKYQMKIAISQRLFFNSSAQKMAMEIIPSP